jgi:hypothetical protein
MPQIEVDHRTYREMELLAVAWHTDTLGEVVARLVTAVATRGVVREARPALPPVAVHAVYAGTRIEATFDREAYMVTFIDGPLAGRTYFSPGDACRAIVRRLNPAVSPFGRGWTFWTVTATGARLTTLR